MISILKANTPQRNLIFFIATTLSTGTIIGMQEPSYQLKIDNLSQSTIAVTKKRTNRKDTVPSPGVFKVSPDRITEFNSTYPLFTITVPGYTPSCFDIWITDQLEKSEHIIISELTYAPEHGKLIKIKNNEEIELATLYAINKKISQ